MDKQRITSLVANGKDMGGHMSSHSAKLSISSSNNNPSPRKYPSSSSSLSNMQTYRSVENIMMDREAALSLLKLSRDTWLQKEVVAEADEDEDIIDENDDDEYEEDEEEVEEEDEWSLFTRTEELRYRCKTCNKGFRSYQALGGHKRIRIHHNGSIASDRVFECHNGSSAGDREFECPLCYKRFHSGQALGGHKRSHAKSVPASFIDLNLPAPTI